jgi:hypothetical protein
MVNLVNDSRPIQLFIVTLADRVGIGKRDDRFIEPVKIKKSQVRVLGSGTIEGFWAKLVWIGLLSTAWLEVPIEEGQTLFQGAG